MIKTYAEIINKTLEYSLQIDKRVIVFGLGATDPKGIFSTTLGLGKFGSDRVFDVPTSENGLTGFAIGASMNGFIPVLSHQRLDFALLSLDQIINGAAKAHYMYGSKIHIPITIRLIIGRGWGQGPTHSQFLAPLFAQIPGLKVVVPSFPNDGKDLLFSSIFDPDPVIFLEHRWLHYSKAKYQNNFKKNQIGKAKIITSGPDLTICSMSYMTLESFKAVKILKKFDIHIELIDLRTINPLDTKTIEKSLNKTKLLLCVDTGPESYSVSSTIVSFMHTKKIKFKKPAAILSMPNFPEPTSYGMTKNFYNNYYDILIKVTELIGKKNLLSKFPKPPKNKHHDIPNDDFSGPF